MSRSKLVEIHFCSECSRKGRKEENSDNTQQLKAEITSLEKWVTENYKSKNLNIIIEIILTKLRQLAAV